MRKDPAQGTITFDSAQELFELMTAAAREALRVADTAGDFTAEGVAAHTLDEAGLL